MAISSTPDMLELYAEFAAPLGTPLTSLVRGGAYVPDSPANAGVPTAPPIGLLQFIGASASTVVITNRGITDSVISPTDADAGFRLASSGQAQELRGLGTTNVSGQWLLSGSAGSYEVFCTVNSGSLSSGSSGVWENLGTTREWHRTRLSNIVGTDTCVITLQIRPAGGGAVLATAQITLNAEVT